MSNDSIKISLKMLVCIIIFIILICLFLVIVLFNILNHNNKKINNENNLNEAFNDGHISNNMQNDIEENIINENIITNIENFDSNIQNNVVNQSNNDIVERDEKFDEALIDYIFESIKVYTKNNYILKDTTGDVSASKLTSEEVDTNEDVYKNEIKNMLGDNTIFSNTFIKDGKQSCTYNFENVLNNLGLGSHMGAGNGCYDTNGNKIYIYGKTEIEEYPPTMFNIIKYFGYDTNEFADVVIAKIESIVNEYDLIDSDGNKLTLSKVKENKKENKRIINDEEIIYTRDIFNEIYFENNKLYCRCYFVSLLNKLGIEVNGHDELDDYTFVLE